MHGAVIHSRFNPPTIWERIARKWPFSRLICTVSAMSPLTSPFAPLSVWIKQSTTTSCAMAGRIGTMKSDILTFWHFFIVGAGRRLTWPILRNISAALDQSASVSLKMPTLPSPPHWISLHSCLIGTLESNSTSMALLVVRFTFSKAIF